MSQHYDVDVGVVSCLPGTRHLCPEVSASLGGGRGALGLHEWWLGGWVCVRDALEAPPEGLLCATSTWGACGVVACSWGVGSWR